ncbi:MAG: ABC transporter substrate-binding protein [Candidatus Caldarchaeum sp.]|uniref:Solute-binding protein family 5 domain-containing protein n=1 Tax=Caldiarchaeum subterraneum TaxID=311458 RepID=A0A7C5Y9D2_CALS0
MTGNRKYLLALLLALLLAFSAAPSIQAQPRHGGTLVVGISSEPPHLALSGPPTWAFYQIVRQIGNSLVSIDPETLEWQPELAESWQVIKERDGGMTIVFKLVRNATWHDGRKFTSADVKFTYEVVAPVFNSFVAYMVKSYVKSIETPDDYTVIFRFNTTWAPAFYPGYFGGSGINISPKHLYENTDIANNPYNTQPIGTGPFKFKEWKKGEYIILERNENYWKKGLPYLDRIIFRIIRTSPALTLAFEKGDVDFIWTYGLTISDAVGLQEKIGLGRLPGKRVWFFPSPGGSLDVVGFNLHPEGPAPLKDVRVRKAIAAAIDRHKIAEVVYFNRVEALDTVVSSAPAVAQYNPGVNQPAYNPALAERLLDEAGYRRGPDGTRFKLRLMIDSVSYPFYLKEAELIRDFLAQVGIVVEIVALDTAAWHERVFRNWDFDMSIFPFVHGPGPTFFIRYYTEKGIVRASWSNAMGYNNPEFNKLIFAAEYEIDRQKEVELVRKALKILVEDQPAVWTCSRTFVAAVNLDFSDELAPGAWENGMGTGYLNLEKIYWVKAPVRTEVITVERTMIQTIIQGGTTVMTTVVKSEVVTVTQPTQVVTQVVPEWAIAAVVVAVVVAVAAVSFAVSRTRKPKT